ncbi:hypothetical protein UFOVP873_6 [uncultured Caudovirales phage]|uniref:Uncharacterized protein n=1 Tax=uncultured Caudovirales phage TaxID=2100421 RepID=A0A6J5PHA6_9CAUD|nr:hypothetical protein UFOVP873_6 [uncultured Caudovirales phage]
MATTTFLGNATINITPTGGTAYDVTDNCRSCSVSVGYEYLESTAFGDTGRRAVQGLQTVSVEMELFLSYGVGEVETLMAAIQTAGSCGMVISPSGTTESASNPEFVLTNCTLEANQGIISTVGELAVVSLSFTNGTWVRDITAP